MASVVQNKRTSESKFVSICADGSEGTPDVDISFREPLLSRPSDHYMVGVDNLTVNMNHLSMMRQSTGIEDFVFRIGRFSNVVGVNEFDPAAGTTPEEQLAAGGPVIAGPGELKAVVFGAPINNVQPFYIEQNYQSFNQFVLALKEYISVLNEKVLSVDLNDGFYANGFNVIAPGAAAGNPPVIPNQAQLDAQAAAVHLSMTIGPDGKLRLLGSRAFWANYFVYIPNAEYQYLLMGQKMAYPYCVSLDAAGTAHAPFIAESATKFLYQANGVPADFEGYTAGSISNAITLAHVEYRNQVYTLQLGANLLSSSDRRIALEIGTSLPIINNPMVDHNQVHPDYTVGRWMWNPRAQLNSLASGIDLRFNTLAPAIHEFQNSTDRVQYHSLMPQDKITSLRLKLYSRIRVYNEGKDRFEMEQVVMPMGITDWWHCRLHFVSKD